ncbi:MAG: S-adenosylmethionine:tRNA ribosyltransferase-isomerase [Hymenobacter sp.]
MTAPLALIQLALPLLAQSPQGRIVNVTSDAGGRGVRRLGRVRVVEGRARAPVARSWPPSSRSCGSWWVDPGDMNTRMHQEAFPGEDISDRPPPEDSVPGILGLDRRGRPERPVPGPTHGPMTAIITTRPPIVFDLPRDLEAHEPPEARGLARDDVRLLVSAARRRARPRPVPRPARHPRPRRPPRHQHLGRPCPSSVDAVRPGGAVRRAPPLHAPARRSVGGRAAPARACRAPCPSTPTSAASPWPCRAGRASSSWPGTPRSGRLWVAVLHLPAPLEDYLALHGRPIRYGHVDRDWPLSAYQTVYANEAGSAEMPSAGRAFTSDLITALVARGVGVSTRSSCTPGSASLETRRAAHSRAVPGAGHHRRRGSMPPGRTAAG